LDSTTTAVNNRNSLPNEAERKLCVRKENVDIVSKHKTMASGNGAVIFRDHHPEKSLAEVFSCDGDS